MSRAELCAVAEATLRATVAGLGIQQAMGRSASNLKVLDPRVGDARDLEANLASPRGHFLRVVLSSPPRPRDMSSTPSGFRLCGPGWSVPAAHADQVERWRAQLLRDATAFTPRLKSWPSRSRDEPVLHSVGIYRCGVPSSQ